MVFISIPEKTRIPTCTESRLLKMTPGVIPNFQYITAKSSYEDGTARVLAS